MFKCDAIRFSKKGELYDPISDDKLKMVTLDLSLSSDLDWEKPKDLEKILWHLDFNLPSISFFDETALSSFLIAIRSFIEKLYLPYREETFGVCLYQGPFFIPFSWNIDHEEALTEWKKEVSFFPNLKELYWADLFSKYLHRLAAALPDEALPFVFFDQIKGSIGRVAQLVSREHFSYLFVSMRNHIIPLPPFSQQARDAVIGVVLPLHCNCSEKSLALVDQVLKKLEGKVRIVSEAYLTESWDGLDILVIFSDFISKQGKRKMQGFAAAGGEIVTEGKRLGILGEISWDEFRGRGI